MIPLPPIQAQLREEVVVVEKEQEEAKAEGFIISSLSEDRSAMIETAKSIATVEVSDTSLQVSPIVAVSEPPVLAEQPQSSESVDIVLVAETDLVSSKTETLAEIETETVTLATIDTETRETPVSLGFRASLYQGFQAALSSLGLKSETSEDEQESETLRLRKRVAELEKEVDDLKSRVAEKDTTKQI